MKEIITNIKAFLGIKTKHLFYAKDVRSLDIDPVCRCGCGKTFSELVKIKENA